MAMNVGAYYAAGGGGGAGTGVFPSDRLYGSAGGVHDVDANCAGVKFDMAMASCHAAAAGYASAHRGFDAATAHGYNHTQQLQQQQQHSTVGLGFSSYGQFDSHQLAAGGKTSSAAVASYPRFDYASCGGGGGQPTTYPTGRAPASLGGATAASSRYLHDAANKFDAIAATGNDVIAQYGGRHFGTAAMMAAAAVASMGGQHPGVGPATCPTLPIYPWMRSMGAGISTRLHIINTVVIVYMW